MAIESESIGMLGNTPAWASGEALPNVVYKLPPSRAGWVARASGSATITVEWVNLSTGNAVYRFTGARQVTGTRTSADVDTHRLATTVGIGVRFTGANSIHTAAICAPADLENVYGMPPTL